jgi:hypothetical protein
MMSSIAGAAGIDGRMSNLDWKRVGSGFLMLVLILAAVSVETLVLIELTRRLN